MGLLFVLSGVVASYLHWTAGAIAMAILSAAATVLSFWSLGVMHNFAVEQARGRSSFRGGFGDFEPGELIPIPRWLTTLNFLSSLVVLVMLAWSVVRLWS